MARERHTPEEITRTADGRRGRLKVKVPEAVMQERRDEK